MTTTHFNQFFQVVINIVTQTYTWLNSIQIGPMSLFTWLVSFMWVAVIFAVIHMLAGVSGGGFISGTVGHVEASRRASAARNAEKEEKNTK